MGSISQEKLALLDGWLEVPVIHELEVAVLPKASGNSIVPLSHPAKENARIQSLKILSILFCKRGFLFFGLFIFVRGRQKKKEVNAIQHVWTHESCLFPKILQKSMASYFRMSTLKGREVSCFVFLFKILPSSHRHVINVLFFFYD